MILNILMNAVHAIKEKHGKEKGNIEITTYAEQKRVYSVIRDDGCGMTEEVRQRIFEPIFTTKPVGQGTGLGLGIAYDIIVNKHQGEILVDSEVGKGTRFILSLPICSGDAEEK